MTKAPTSSGELIELVTRAGRINVQVVDGVNAATPASGAAVILKSAIEVAQRSSGDARQVIPVVAVERLLTISILAGALEQALETASDAIARSLGVERCLISIRGDSSSGAVSAGHTWDSLSWDRTVSYCRAAATYGVTLIAPSSGASGCESVLAVPLGNQGFVGLIVSGVHVFAQGDHAALLALGSRFAAELNWRGAHQATTDELDRLVNGPGLDRMLGIWNRTAMGRLMSTQASAARRFGLPLSLLAVEVADLEGINHRHGHAMGDRLLRRVADAIQAIVRSEDEVSRLSGSKLVVSMLGTPLEGASRVAERLREAFDSRSVELDNGDALRPSVLIGVATLQSNEEPTSLITRAVDAALRARVEGTVIARATTGRQRPRSRLSQQVIDISEDVRTTLGGSYRLLHEISRGGMGVVYRAEDLSLERQVAIKMLRPDLAEDRTFVEHLRAEASMLARIQHPNLVQIYNFGQSGGDSYFVMELVEGEALQQAIERHRAEHSEFPLLDGIATIAEVASALDALHERGIIHRDVKPANLIRDPFRDRSVLVDVGIARRHGHFVQIAGTPGYVAPEVFGGAEATARSDVYGLACSAYTMLTLTTPFGEDEEAIDRQASEEPPRLPSAFRPELRPIDDLLLNALSKDPDRRPASAGELARSMRAALDVKTIFPTRDRRARTDKPAVPSTDTLPARTRGVVFRSVTRALGVRGGERLRDGIGNEHADVVRALAEAAPLEWLPTELLTRLIAVAPAHVDRDATVLARDIARATVRASFRRFFPASAATLDPDRTLSAIRTVWARYHTWGVVASLPVRPTETVVRITDTLHEPTLCAWTTGMLEQLVTLSGGRSPSVDHSVCEARGDQSCMFLVTWNRDA
jgi:uncharacterized protein (TIGR02265 family)